jgi:hypothetical protein
MMYFLKDKRSVRYVRKGATFSWTYDLRSARTFNSETEAHEFIGLAKDKFSNRRNSGARNEPRGQSDVYNLAIIYPNVNIRAGYDLYRSIEREKNNDN